jgi:5-methylthioribose kinase
MTADQFYQATGSRHFLQLTDPAGVEAYLRGAGFLHPAEEFRGIEKPGEGNMNLTLRVRTGRRTFILKQSRPWVEKYPQLAAPAARILVETAFLEATRHNPAVRSRTPELLAADPANYVLLLADLGDAGDLTWLYRSAESLPADQLRDLLAYLAALHGQATGEFPDNLALRRLNHEHIFVFPYRNDTGFDLDTVLPGLAAAARPYRADQALIDRVTALGQRYLLPGPCLLHGDFYPGSWLRTPEQLWVIDAEFAHLGMPEFDLGVLLAHLDLSQATPEQIATVWAAYQAPAGFDTQLAQRLRGVEVIRRLIGLAQLPLDLTLEERQDLLAKARKMILE